MIEPVKSGNKWEKKAFSQKITMQQKLSWKNGRESFESDNEKLLIEDYDDELSSSSEDTVIDVAKLDLIKRNLTNMFEIDQTNNANTLYKHQLNVESGLQDDLCHVQLAKKSSYEINIQEELTQERVINFGDQSLDDHLSGTSSCDLNIQEELSQENSRSQIIEIECSTSPLTSLQVSKHSKCLSLNRGTQLLHSNLRVAIML